MDNEEFRAEAHRLVDWMADYLRDVERYPVRAQVAPGDIARRLPAGPPDAPEAMAAIMADFERDIVPGLTHWQHPNFYAYFPANSSPPSVLAEMLTATVAAQCMLWQTSPAATEMETRVLDWLRQMIGLPEGFTGVIQDSASSAALCALLAGRERATNWRANREGLAAVGPIAVYCTAETHSAVEKNARIIGVGAANVRKVAVDDDLAIDPAALDAAIAADTAAGVTPICIVATIGSTGTSGVDSLGPIGEVAARHGVYLHVDAAWAGSALILPEYRHLLAGADHVDSFAFNPHKWLFTNFDCSAHFVRDPDVLIRTLSISPEFLKSPEGDRVIDYRDWSVPLGRRFRALKLWFVIRSYGVTGLQDRIRAHIAMAQDLAARIAATPDFEVVTPCRLALFTFRYRPAGIETGAELDRLNERLLTNLNDSGKAYFTQNRVRGAYVIRWSIGVQTTEQHHVDQTWDLVQRTARALEPVAAPGRVRGPSAGPPDRA